MDRLVDPDGFDHPSGSRGHLWEWETAGLTDDQAAELALQIENVVRAFFETHGIPWTV